MYVHGSCDNTPNMLSPIDFDQDDNRNESSCVTVAKVDKFSTRYLISEEECNKLNLKSNMHLAMGGINMALAFTCLIYNVISERPDNITNISIMALVANGSFFLGQGLGMKMALSHTVKYNKSAM